MSINGVDTHTLFATIDAVKGQPELAKFQFRARSRWVSGTHNRSTVNGYYGAGQEFVRATDHQYDADHPPVLTGSDEGPTPVEFLHHALAACLTSGLANIAAARGIPLTEVESTVEGDIDLRGILGLDPEVRNGFQGIRVTFAIHGDGSPEQLQELVAQSRKRSAVFDVLTNGRGHHRRDHQHPPARRRTVADPSEPEPCRHLGAPAPRRRRGPVLVPRRPDRGRRSRPDPRRHHPGVAMTTFASPEDTLRSVIQTVDDQNPYADPRSAEREDAGRGLARLILGDLVGAAALLAPLGFTTTDAVDPVSGRRFAMALSETGATTKRRWGLYLVDLSAPLGLCIAVPHPKFDENCELLALRLWRAVPGSMLAMATVHRNAANKEADTARNPESVFQHLWTEVLGPRGVPQVQIHGFANETAPEEVAVSTGVGPVSPMAVRIADGIAATGLVTTRSWVGTTVDPDLRATKNVQGIAANANDWVWVHIEHAKSVRDSEATWTASIDAVAAANPTALVYDRPAPSGSGRPRPVGAACVGGTSRYFAREDHVHAGATPEARSAPVMLVDTATVTVDASRGDYFRVAVSGDRTLAAPGNGTDGQRILVEVLATDADRILSLDASIMLCVGIQVPVTIPAGKRWFAWLIHSGPAGWILSSAALQA